MTTDRDFMRFQHRAMATVFEIMIAGEEPFSAESAAHAAFGEVDRLEMDLSRYLPNSDISRINNLPPHGTAKIGWDTFQCLHLGKRFSEETGGAFDITLGALMDCWVAKDKSLRHPSPDEVRLAHDRTGMGNLELDEEAMTIRVGATAPFIDLGAIGKGYAVDCAVGLLKEWGVASALVHGGTSSTYAFGELPGFEGWPVTISDPMHSDKVLQTIVLSEAGLSGSGIRNGMHIIDPRRSRPVEGRHAAWVIADTAARSDALSTACMVMAEEEIRAMVGRDSRLRALIAGSGGESLFRAGWGEAV